MKLDPDLKETVYSPASRMLNFRELLNSMLSDLKVCRFLAWRLFVRNLLAQHRQTVLGYLWLLLPPVVTTGIWVFLDSQKILNVAEVNIPYPIFVLTGTILWQGFVDSLNSPFLVLTESKAMLSKVNFPHEALIIAGLGGVFFNFCVRIALLFIVFFLFDFSVPISLVFIPLGIFAIILFGATLGLLLLPLGLLYGDVHRALTVISGLWFFVTPVVYPAPSTDSWSAVLISKINPISPLLITTRQWLTGTGLTHLGSFVVISAISLCLFLVGWIVYRLAMPYIVERIGS